MKHPPKSVAAVAFNFNSSALVNARNATSFFTTYDLHVRCTIEQPWFSKKIRVHEIVNICKIDMYIHIFDDSSNKNLGTCVL